MNILPNGYIELERKDVLELTALKNKPEFITNGSWLARKSFFEIDKDIVIEANRPDIIPKTGGNGFEEAIATDLYIKVKGEKTYRVYIGEDTGTLMCINTEYDLILRKAREDGATLYMYPLCGYVLGANVNVAYYISPENIVCMVMKTLVYGAVRKGVDKYINQLTDLSNLSCIRTDKSDIKAEPKLNLASMLA